MIELNTSVQDIKSSVTCELKNNHLTVHNLKDAIKREELGKHRISVTTFLEGHLYKLSATEPTRSSKPGRKKAAPKKKAVIELSPEERFNKMLSAKIEETNFLNKKVKTRALLAQTVDNLKGIDIENSEDDFLNENAKNHSLIIQYGHHHKEFKTINAELIKEVIQFLIGKAETRVLEINKELVA